MLSWLTGGIEGPLTALFALCAVAGVVVLLRRWQHRAGEGRRATVETRADRREADAIRRSLEELLAEVERTTARLDERVAMRLRELEDAERRIDARLADVNAAATPREIRTKSDAQAPLTATTAALADGGRHPAATPEPLPQTRGPIIARSSRPIEADARFAPLYTLADAGASPAAVAEKTGLPLGEVEIILGLRRLAVNPQ